MALHHTCTHSLKIRAMAVCRERSAFDEVSRNDRQHGERATRHRMESRIFFPSYRYRRPIIFPCRPKARKPLASYMGRLTLQCELRNRQMFTEIHDLPEIQPIPNKYEGSTRQRDLKEKFSKKSSLAGFKNNCWLPQIKQVKKGFSYLSPILSFLFIAITGDIISEITVGIFVSGIIVGIFFSEVIAGIFFCI